ncbi:MAG: histidinol-phosphatase [Clostridia bacterium]|nr:histidinol-phosphatase [Clostridia bacterium]
MIKYNFHTHTSFCDGKNTAEEMVLSAIENGFSDIGFSGHSYTPFNTSYCMMDTGGYIEEIKRLKEKYKGQINVWLGIELDAFSDMHSGFDYTIGSAHFLLAKDKYYEVDLSADGLKNALIEGFDGDVKGFYSAYYNTLVEGIKKHKPSFVGHFDLITKFSETEPLFDEFSAEYQKMAINALDEIIKYCNVFEVNTGAMSRGYKRKPYPSEWILRQMKSRDIRLILSSDSHAVDTLNYAFDETIELIKDCGLYDKLIKEI